MSNSKQKQIDMWDHYIVNENDNYYAKCNYCKRNISRGKCLSTSNWKKHLSQHSVEIFQNKREKLLNLNLLESNVVEDTDDELSIISESSPSDSLIDRPLSRSNSNNFWTSTTIKPCKIKGQPTNSDFLHKNKPFKNDDYKAKKKN